MAGGAFSCFPWTEAGGGMGAYAGIGMGGAGKGGRSAGPSPLFFVVSCDRSTVGRPRNGLISSARARVPVTAAIASTIAAPAVAGRLSLVFLIPVTSLVTGSPS